MTGTGGSVSIDAVSVDVMKWSYSPKINIHDTTPIGSRYSTSEQGLMEGECNLTLKATIGEATQAAIISQLKSGTFTNLAVVLTVSAGKTWAFPAALTGVGNSFESNGLYVLEISLKQNGNLTATPWD